MTRLRRVIRAWWRRKPIDRAIADAERAVLALRTDEQVIEAAARRMVQAQPVPAPEPAVKLCRQCRWITKGLFEDCRCPRQPQYDDRLGSDDWIHASIVRRYHCHGDWWEAR